MSTRCQFIAGATCPVCHAMDRIRRCRDDQSGRDWIECVSCGHNEDLPTEAEGQSIPIVILEN
ncbi:MAG: YheV family putative metal-binding protein [Pseudomonadales bacterium]|nr:YheV family putative metal-binding protein [Pseudomonadales bacterium]